jgi:hypothetical protein
MPLGNAGPFCDTELHLVKRLPALFSCCSKQEKALLCSTPWKMAGKGVASDALENGRERGAQQGQSVTASAMDQSIYRSHVPRPPCCCRLPSSCCVPPLPPALHHTSADGGKVTVLASCTLCALALPCSVPGSSTLQPLNKWQRVFSASAENSL